MWTVHISRTASKLPPGKTISTVCDLFLGSPCCHPFELIDSQTREFWVYCKRYQSISVVFIHMWCLSACAVIVPLMFLHKVIKILFQPFLCSNLVVCENSSQLSILLTKVLWRLCKNTLCNVHVEMYVSYLLCDNFDHLITNKEITRKCCECKILIIPEKWMSG